ncbi:hypothetical protein KS4_22580 [Poriferisphaera corsica]|uniref:Uncharacterized protein n=1 Tax=Poriferisphaera corsica TaxID=2528020 RepID=A0A517YVD7_9BACT|nr:hypothetical protein [Poriferisphaera corsica]QDU34195.1 hypothetical protein KS4_22580 [Poriferisphaera corsica]
MKRKVIASVVTLFIVSGLVAALYLPSYGQDDDNDMDKAMQNEQRDGMMMQQDDMDGAMMDDDMRGRMGRHGMRHDGKMDDQGMMMRRGMGMGMDRNKMMGGKMGMMDGKWGKGQMCNWGFITWYLKVGQMYLNIVDQYTEVADDQDKASVSAILGSEKLFDTQEAYAAYLEHCLPDAPNDTVKRAIQMKLTEIYGKSDDPQMKEKATDIVHKLITQQD